MKNNKNRKTNGKNIATHLLATVCLLMCVLACGKTEMPERGVSQQLAQSRRQNIDSVRYGLQFQIPDTITQPITGEVCVSFSMQEPADVILDFRADSSSIFSVDKEYCFVNEHIVIPQSQIAKGTNSISIRFTVADRSVNRRNDLLYTLLVPDRARTLFPCFDQPDLKACFNLTLSVPQGWLAVSNSKILRSEEKGGFVEHYFGTTEPLSSYLFAFIAGKMERTTHTTATGQDISVYYRESDPKKLAQIPELFRQVEAALQWMEDYTGIPYPFSKYDFITIPGFQYGGMEHTGATFYNDSYMFLSEHPTINEELARAQLIAHETAHMWFGDLVTMCWFNDVWIKEVFAGYFASRIIEPRFPTVNHRLNDLKKFGADAFVEDRTPWSAPIRQPLDNLADAGLIYSNIVYNKAPLVMSKLIEFMGEANFHEGIVEYLHEYAYSNATWDDLIAILSRHTERDIREFSHVWVSQGGMPVITMQCVNDSLVVTQNDPRGRGLVWPQQFGVVPVSGGRLLPPFEVVLTGESRSFPLPAGANVVIPNSDGRGYGTFLLDSAVARYLSASWSSFPDELMRQSVVMMLYENYQNCNIDETMFVESLMQGLNREPNMLILSTCVGQLGTVMPYLSENYRNGIETRLAAMVTGDKLPSSLNLQLYRLLFSQALSPQVTATLYERWKSMAVPLYSERDYMQAAYELAIRLPERRDEIGQTQRARLTSDDRHKEFAYIWRATTADTLQRDSLFRWLTIPANRQIEPWAAQALSLLNHPLRETQSVKYIYPGLEQMVSVQRTGDIFFPLRWSQALLGRHTSREAYRQAQHFLDSHAGSGYSTLLRSKIELATYPLYRRWGKDGK